MSLRKSVGITFLSANSLTVLSVLSSMVLARLLSPGQIGAYAVSAVLIAIVHQFRDFGTTNYLIQAPKLDQEQIGKAFAITLVSSWTIAILLFILAPLGEIFYRSPDVRRVIHVLGLNFLIIPFGSITLTLLRRELRFKERAVIDHVSAISGVFVAILTAYAGLGAVSLAWGTVSSTVGGIVTSYFFRPKQYKWSISFSGLSNLAEYGITVTGSSLVTQLNRGVAELIGGRMLGLDAVGLFNKARSVTDQIGALLLGVANQVTLPVLVSRHREGQDIAPIYLKAIELLTGLVWPVCVFAGIMPFEIIRTMFGVQWDAAIPSLRLLCLLGILGSPFWLWTQVFYALGFVKKVLIGESFSLAISASALLISINFGVNNIALALVCSTPLGISLLYWFVHNSVKFNQRDFLAICFRSAVPALLCGLCTWALAITIPLENPFLRILVVAPLAVAGWLCGLMLVRHALMVEIKIAIAWVSNKIT